jgi:GxxExxY protein
LSFYQRLSAPRQRLQRSLSIINKGSPLNKTYQTDFFCYNTVILEIKAVDLLGGLEQAQLLNSLKASGLKVGLRVNFGSPSLEYKRLVYNL